MKVTRGDIVRVNLGEPKGDGTPENIVRGERPALVVQNNKGNKHAPITNVIPITSKSRRLPVVVKILPDESGLPRISYVNCTNIMTVEIDDIIRKEGRITPKAMSRIENAIKIQLGLDD
ncbi:type II toxin-antitoxin system PemK/MazF family toxin [Candidatus Poseidonia alphae]|nr:type II toxin-antitoxin system PemK/MazF family toxin [Candidatus Poseidonia alphae]